MSDPEVCIIVPTRDSGFTLRACLQSVREQTVSARLVVVDNFSADDTAAIARGYADEVIVIGPERSRQRNVGAAAAGGCRIIGFVDSDMVLTPSVVSESIASLDAGAVAAIIPERSVGAGYWTRVRAFERTFYEGSDGIEAARIFRRDVFEQLGGYDETLDAGEDWDLTIRARKRGVVARISAWIDHDEGALTYRGACAKKARYAEGVVRYLRKHGRPALAGGFDRPWLRQPWRLFVPSPKLGAGLVALKAGEATAMAIALMRRSRW